MFPAGARISGQTLSYLWPSDTDGMAAGAQQTPECVDQRPRAGSTWVRAARAEPRQSLQDVGSLVRRGPRGDSVQSPLLQMRKQAQGSKGTWPRSRRLWEAC